MVVSTNNLIIFLLMSLGLLGAALLAYIFLMVGASHMKNKTEDESFGTAMVLFILFFVPFLFAVGVLVFGSALHRLAEKGEKRVCPKCGREEDASSLFCPSCGEKIK
jgi:FtsH-binding integral membrane protein